MSKHGSLFLLAVSELLSNEDESLLVLLNFLFILNHDFIVVDSVRLLDIQINGLSNQGLDKDIHASSNSKDQVES